MGWTDRADRPGGSTARRPRRDFQRRLALSASAWVIALALTAATLMGDPRPAMGVGPAGDGPAAVGPVGDGSALVGWTLGDTTAIFVLYGSAYEEYTTKLWLDPDTLRFENLRSGSVVHSILGVPGPGKFSCAFVDYGSSLGAVAGDQIEIFATSAELFVMPSTITLTHEQVSAGVGEIEIWIHLYASNVQEPEPVPELKLVVSPNPCAREDTRIELLIPSGMPGPAREAFRIFDSGGRLVRILPMVVEPGYRIGAMWDGRDSRGGVLPAGVYWVAATIHGSRRATEIVRLR